MESLVLEEVMLEEHPSLLRELLNVTALSSLALKQCGLEGLKAASTLRQLQDRMLLEKVKQLRQLDLSRNALGQEGAETWFCLRCFFWTIALPRTAFKGCFFVLIRLLQSKSQEFLAEALALMPQIEVLLLAGNALGPSGLEVLTSFSGASQNQASMKPSTLR